ncbi:NUDIX hydrolase [Candidatus Dojkabacteria bacterium]|nr:NUDIX hydrolase [Candidatus Dojkabacteria bacterium]
MSSEVRIDNTPERDKALNVSVVLVTGFTPIDGICFLLAERTETGQMTFPGGTMEPEEISTVETATRELREETGLEMPISIQNELAPPIPLRRIMDDGAIIDFHIFVVPLVHMCTAVTNGLDEEIGKWKFYSESQIYSGNDKFRDVRWILDHIRIKAPAYFLVECALMQPRPFR